MFLLKHSRLALLVCALFLISHAVNGKPDGGDGGNDGGDNGGGGGGEIVDEFDFEGEEDITISGEEYYSGGGQWRGGGSYDSSDGGDDGGGGDGDQGYDNSGGDDSSSGGIDVQWKGGKSSDNSKGGKDVQWKGGDKGGKDVQWKGGDKGGKGVQWKDEQKWDNSKDVQWKGGKTWKGGKNWKGGKGGQWKDGKTWKGGKGIQWKGGKTWKGGKGGQWKDGDNWDNGGKDVQWKGGKSWKGGKDGKWKDGKTWKKGDKVKGHHWKGGNGGGIIVFFGKIISLIAQFLLGLTTQNFGKGPLFDLFIIGVKIVGNFLLGITTHHSGGDIGPIIKLILAAVTDFFKLFKSGHFTPILQDPLVHFGQFFLDFAGSKIGRGIIFEAIKIGFRIFGHFLFGVKAHRSHAPVSPFIKLIIIAIKDFLKLFHILDFFHEPWSHSGKFFLKLGDWKKGKGGCFFEILRIIFRIFGNVCLGYNEHHKGGDIGPFFHEGFSAFYDLLGLGKKVWHKKGH